MDYRSIADRRISTYGALLFITIFGAGATLLIVHAASNVVLTPENETSVLSTLDKTPI